MPPRIRERIVIEHRGDRKPDAREDAAMTVDQRVVDPVQEPRRCAAAIMPNDTASP